MKLLKVMDSMRLRAYHQPNAALSGIDESEMETCRAVGNLGLYLFDWIRQRAGSIALRRNLS